MSLRKLWEKAFNRETVSYLIAGLCTTVVSLAAFAVADYLGAGTALSNTVSHVLATLFAYLVNKVFVFRSTNWQPKYLGKEFMKFIGARVFTFVGETALLVVLVDFMGFGAMPTKMFTMCLVVLANYVLSKLVVFKP